MATLSRDNGSDWHASGVRRRDFRHVKDGPEVGAGGGRKSTRIWCGGKVGRRHTLPAPLSPQPSLWEANRCARCGKYLRRQLVAELRGAASPGGVASSRPQSAYR